MENNEASSRSTKVQKCHEQATDLGTGGRDRISNLPDPILGEILSSFSTKEAVRTSVLSKQWRYVWTGVPCIDINDRLLLSKDRKPLEFERCFIDFVDRVLRLNNVSPLEKVWFRWSENYGLSRFSEWMSIASIRDVKVFCLDYLGWTISIELPPCIFTCKKLVILRLCNQLSLNVHESAFLPSLKVLHLYLVEFLDYKSIKNLIAGCPVLEELDMDWRYDGFGTTLHIQSSSLKSFRLQVNDAITWDSFRMVLDAKNLERIALRDFYTEQFDLLNSLSSVVSVSLDISPKIIATEVLKKMSKTKYLNLGFNTMENLEVAPLNNFPVFRYLTHLVVVFFPSSRAVLPYLLECSPNLITFECSQELSYDVDNEEEFYAPKCFMLHLESINIFGCDWSENEMRMVMYFLKKATVLKHMYILPTRGNFTRGALHVCKELCRFSKTMTACEIEILFYNCSVGKEFPCNNRVRDSDPW